MVKVTITQHIPVGKYDSTEKTMELIFDNHKKALEFQVLVQDCNNVLVEEEEV